MTDKIKEKILKLSEKISFAIWDLQHDKIENGRNSLFQVLREGVNTGMDDMAQAWIARSYAMEGNIKKAEEEFKAALDNKPNNHIISLAYGEFMLNQKRFLDAKKLLLPFRDLNISHFSKSSLYEMLGLISVSEKDFVTAEKYLNLEHGETFKKEPYFPSTELVERLVEAGYFNSAVPYLKEIISKFEKDEFTHLQARYLLGKYYENIGKIKNAIEEYNFCLDYVKAKGWPDKKGLKAKIDELISNLT